MPSPNSTQRAINLHITTYDRLVAEQERLAGILGFKPTFGQVIEHLLSRNETSRLPLATDIALRYNDSKNNT